MRVAYTAGEAIGPDLFVFYRSIGINLKQLYGSTETAVFVCLQPDDEARADTVGVPIEGVEIKVEPTAARSWCARPGLLKEYYKNPEATAEVLNADGWYHTGDAGFFDAAGHLKIIDRAKDVGRIAGGAHDGTLFAPKYVENKLKFFPYIKEAVAFGDGRDEGLRLHQHRLRGGRQLGRAAQPRRTPATPTWRRSPRCSSWCASASRRSTPTSPPTRKLAGSQISRFLILHKELDADDGELTRTRKVRRGFIAEQYAVLVDALYGGRASSTSRPQVHFEDGRTGMVAADAEDRRRARRFAADRKRAA